MCLDVLLKTFWRTPAPQSAPPLSMDITRVFQYFPIACLYYESKTRHQTAELLWSHIDYLHRSVAKKCLISQNTGDRSITLRNQA
jgi:hypothetical protein